MSPIVVLAVIPSIAALILGHGPIEIAGMIKEGVSTTTSNGILFIFSVIYFGVLSDTGLFDIIVNWLVKKAGNNVIAVTVATAIIATIAHLDGTTATTVLITIPALYPVYKKMKIDPKILLCLTGACMGVMNLLPWGGPTARAATVLQMDANELWHILIPVQIMGLVFSKEQLYRQIWDDAVVDDNTITVYIKRIRGKIERDPKKPVYLKTIRGIGYRLDIDDK